MALKTKKKSDYVSKKNKEGLSRVKSPGHVKKHVSEARKKYYKQDLTKESFRLMEEFGKLGKTKSTRRGVKTYKPKVSKGQYRDGTTKYKEGE